MATNDEDPLTLMAGETPWASISGGSDLDASKPTIIGIYGQPGSGKTRMLKLLGNALSEDRRDFHLIEGSEMIQKFLPQDVVLETFKFQSEEVKLTVRTNAINDVVRMCCEDGMPAIVTGHFIFWDGGGEVSKPVISDADKQAFTHILYLDVKPEVIGRRREKVSRTRAVMEVDKLEQWQKAEMSGLQELCRENEILFTTVHDHSEATKLIKNFVRFNSTKNEEHVAQVLRMGVEGQAFGHDKRKLGGLRRRKAGNDRNASEHNGQREQDQDDASDRRGQDTRPR